MGELLLCSQEIASVPYYIETTGWNIYSLEELCYYLLENVEWIEPGFMDEELCRWIKNELKMPGLSERLQKIIREGKSLAEFVVVLAEGCNYCTAEEIRHLQKSLQLFENKSEGECAKIRADRFLAQERYSICIQAYSRLLEQPEILEGSSLLVGNIWHNLGTAYAGLFLFEQAAECYERAYRRNGNPLSMQQAKEAKRLAGDEYPVNGKQISDEEEEQKKLLEKWIWEYRRSCR